MSDNPQTERTYMLFDPVTLTLTQWPWYMNFTWVFWNVRVHQKWSF